DRRPWSATRSKRRSGRGRRAIAPETARRTPPGWMSGFDLTPSGERGQSDIGMTSTLICIVEQSVAPVGCEQPFHVVEGLGRGVRHLLDGARHVLGADRADVDAEPCAFPAQLRIPVAATERGLPPPAPLP